MNDPGLHEPIEEEAQVVDESGGPPNEAGEDAQKWQHELAPFLQPARWWLASTAFPLIAGTLGPMASAFSICSLVSPWRMQNPAGHVHEVDIPDPKWDIAVNAVSLAIAIIANFVLLMNMARRISFEIAEPIIIIGWYLSSFLLIGVQVAFRIKENPPAHPNIVFSQSYYYSVMAAGLYFVIATLLVVTLYGALKGHYSRQFHLTSSQRTLMLQTIVFLIYLLGGAAVYTKVENWRFLDALYWADVTVLTIGFGNFTPVTHLGRGLLFPYGVGGILILGIIIGSIRSLMLEKGKQKVGDRMTEKTRRLFIKKALTRRSIFHSLVPRLEVKSDMSEADKRRQEFMLMRQVRELATWERKWLSLLLSVIVWLTMWLVGALAFYRSEEGQGWTYFESLYFAYVSLLTIGYGDFFPISDWGVPFFIFWSLLAVPTLTILISNIGDTLVRSVKDLVLYVGELTILPGDRPTRERIKDMFRESWLQKLIHETSDFEPATSSNDDEQPKRRKKASDISLEEAARCPLGDMENEMEAYEHHKEQAARERGDVRAENIHHYHYLLFRELRKMIKYAASGQPKEFTYEEWEYYLKLIQADAPASKFRSGPLPGVAIEEDGSTSHQLEEYRKHAEDKDGSQRRWSWIDPRNPLICDKSEAEWLLEALAETLERELHRASKGYHDGPKNREDGEGSAAAAAASSSSSSSNGPDGDANEDIRQESPAPSTQEEKAFSKGPA